MDIIKLKSEFKTSKEIWVEVEDTRRTRDSSEEQLIRELQVEQQLWLSKENYERRVEEFKIELEKIYKACDDKRVYEIQVMIGNLGLKINKLLGEK